MPARSVGGVSARRTPLLLTVALLALGCVLWAWRLGSAPSLDYDEGVYLMSARLLLQGRRAYGEVFSSQPPLFLDLLHAAFWAFGDSVLVGRGLVLASAVIVCGLAGYLAWTLVAPRAAPWAVVLCGGSLLFLRGARTVQSELPALALAVGALALVAGRGPAAAAGRRILAGALFGLAMATKLLVAPMALPLLAAVTAPRRDGPGAAARAAAGTALAAAAAFLLACAPHGLTEVFRQSIAFHLAPGARAMASTSGAAFLGGEALLLAAAGLGLVALGLGGRAVATRLLLAWLASLTAFVLLHRPVFAHNLVAFIPPLAVAAGGVLAAAADGVLAAPRRRAATVVLVVACLLELGGPGMPRFAPAVWVREVGRVAPPEEAQAVAAIRAWVGPGELVVTDAQWLAFVAGRAVPAPLCDTSLKRIASGSLTAAMVDEQLRRARAVLLWTGRLELFPELADRLRREGSLVFALPAGRDHEARALYLIGARQEW
jgi:4-amino-4-deoxy-L-arabinose transferase-like glycosyltransferase